MARRLSGAARRGRRRAWTASGGTGSSTLATAVAEAMEHGHHLVAEAPTGSGKSLAYLAPAVASGLKVVVATSTIALQSQLVGKDLPALARARRRAVHVRAAEGPVQLRLPGQAARRGAARRAVRDAGRRRLLRAAATARARSPTSPRPATAPRSTTTIADSSWAAVSCTAMECPGRANCADGDDCFAELARDRARGVDILVVNHALYCAHLASHGNVLPEHDLVILDEAHAFADNATNAFGADLSPDVLVRLSGMLAPRRRRSEARSTRSRTRPSISPTSSTSARAESTSETDEQLQLRAPLGAPNGSPPRTPKLKNADADNAKRTVATRDRAARSAATARRSPRREDVVWIEKVRRNASAARRAGVGRRSGRRTACSTTSR